jgi:hypothetical protein
MTFPAPTTAKRVIIDTSAHKVNEQKRERIQKTVDSTQETEDRIKAEELITKARSP